MLEYIVDYKIKENIILLTIEHKIIYTLEISQVMNIIINPLLNKK